MQFSNYRIIYFNIILIFLFYTNQFFLFLLFFFLKLPYVLNLESDIEYQFDFNYASFDDIDARYLENDIDNEYYYILIHMETYLYNSCRFFFDILGGEQTLDFIDFFDFTIYNINDAKYKNINRNYKNIYINNIVYKNIKTMHNIYNYKIYQYIDYYINDNYLRDHVNFFKNMTEQEYKENENNNNIKLKKKMRQEIFMYDNNICDRVKEQRRFKIFDILKQKF